MTKRRESLEWGRSDDLSRIETKPGVEAALSGGRINLKRRRVGFVPAGVGWRVDCRRVESRTDALPVGENGPINCAQRGDAAKRAEAAIAETRLFSARCIKRSFL